MMETFYYLYYKLYKATLKGSLNDIAEWAAAIYFSLLVFLNLLVIGAFLRKIDLLPFFFTGTRQVAAFMIFIVLLAFLLFLNNKRFKQIVEKFDKEEAHERQRGNIRVWIYVILSIISVFVVALYKPGKL